MNIGMIGILVAFAAFIVLLILNPKLSCFGRRLSSPFYPLLRKRKLSRRASGQKKVEDYGFRLEDEQKPGSGPRVGKAKKTEDYGFRLD
jgi:hypothetical protein